MACPMMVLSIYWQANGRWAVSQVFETPSVSLVRLSTGSLAIYDLMVAKGT
jgi:hypothetical protein